MYENTTVSWVKVKCGHCATNFDSRVNGEKASRENEQCLKKKTVVKLSKERLSWLENCRAGVFVARAFFRFPSFRLILLPSHVIKIQSRCSAAFVKDNCFLIDGFSSGELLKIFYILHFSWIIIGRLKATQLSLTSTQLEIWTTTTNTNAC